MNKIYTNKQLKLIILDLYKSHNITIDNELNKQLNQSSKTQYKKLLTLYNDIKTYIEDNISKSSYEIIYDNNIDVIKKEIETQTEEIKEDLIYEEYKQIKTELFQMKQIISNLKYKCCNYKKIIKEISNKKIENTYSSSNNSDDENNNLKEHRKINYYQLTELSSQNIINELSKLSKHNLKQLYNKYFSNKHHRQLN